MIFNHKIVPAGFTLFAADKFIHPAFIIPVLFAALFIPFDKHALPFVRTAIKAIMELFASKFDKITLKVPKMVQYIKEKGDSFKLSMLK